ncbi:ABC transporter permease [Deltaproteobacteria bacterium]|nr:ABC transporter permease [Deltaproteobacteria bacterium]
MTVILTSLAVSGSATILALLIGLPLASWCSKHQSKSFNWLKIMIRTLYGLPPVVVGVVVYLALSRKGPFGDLELLFTIEGMIIAQMILILPLVWGLSWSAFDKIPKEVLETHGLLGTKNMMLSRLQEARVGIISAVLVGFGRAVAEVGAVMIIGGNIAGKTRVMTTSIVLDTQQGNLDSALISGGLLLLIALFASGLALKLEIEKFSSKNYSEKAPIFNKYSANVVVKNLNWEVDNKLILNKINLLSLEKCSAVLGASGSGKSSLLRHIAGLIDSNSIKVEGKIMMVHQKPVILHGSVLQNICHAGVGGEEAMWWLKQVNLENLKNKSPKTLSGGEKQRLALVRALASQPDILLLDEFTASLDGINVEMMERLVQDHLNRGAMVFLATHNSLQAKRLSKQIIILDDGKVVTEKDVPQSLLNGSWLG